MKEFVKKVCRPGVALKEEERNLLSVAYKNVVGPRRASWRVLMNVGAKGADAMPELVTQYRVVVETELKAICDEILQLLDVTLITSSLDTESLVFYHKMAGDYYRYLAEFQTDDALAASKEAAGREYTKALGFAENGNPPSPALHPTNPIRLGLALNCSVFFFEIMNEPEKACKLAREAFDAAVSELEGVEDNVYKDATLIMQLLRDNLTLWTDSSEGGEVPDM